MPRKILRAKREFSTSRKDNDSFGDGLMSGVGIMALILAISVLLSMLSK